MQENKKKNLKDFLFLILFSHHLSKEKKYVICIGESLCFCNRCTGFWSGIIIGFILIPFIFSTSLLWIIIYFLFLLVGLIHFFLCYTKRITSGRTERILTGFISGIGFIYLFFYFLWCCTSFF